MKIVINILGKIINLYKAFKFCWPFFSHTHTHTNTHKHTTHTYILGFDTLHTQENSINRLTCQLVIKNIDAFFSFKISWSLCNFYQKNNISPLFIIKIIMTLKKGNDLFIIINIVGHSMCLSLSCVEISSGRERELEREIVKGK